MAMSDWERMKAEDWDQMVHDHQDMKVVTYSINEELNNIVDAVERMTDLLEELQGFDGYEDYYDIDGFVNGAQRIFKNLNKKIEPLWQDLDEIMDTIKDGLHDLR